MGAGGQQFSAKTLTSAGGQGRGLLGGRLSGRSPWPLVAAVGFLAAGLLALGFGFRAVSDDDYARVLLAQRFAQAPHVDPTGSSWLPFPFWTMGTLMRALGPTLAVARGFALASAFASGLVLWASGRVAGLSSGASALGALASLIAPSLALLAAAPLPELPSAALATYGVAAACFGGRGALFAGGVALLAACLSRYEVWPLAAVAALICLARARTARTEATPTSTAQGGGGSVRLAALASALLAIAGPLAWVGWNLKAHGSALWFARRVASYHASVAPGASALSGLIEGYPLALLREAPGLLFVVAVALAWRGARKRWALFLTAGLVQVVALCAAQARGGAPTHHPERTLAATFCLLALAAAGEAEQFWRARAGAPKGRGPFSDRRAFRTIMAISALTLVASSGFVWRLLSLPEGFGLPRSEELALGRVLAERVGAGERVLVAPSSYGYLATLVTFGRPDDVTALVPKEVDPRSTADDPFESEASLAHAVEQAGARWVLATGGQRSMAEASGLHGGPLTGTWWLYDARGAKAP